MTWQRWPHVPVALGGGRWGFPRSASSQGLFFDMWPSLLTDVTWLVHTHHCSLWLCWVGLLGQFGKEGWDRGYTAPPGLSDSVRWTEVDLASWVQE